MATNRIKWLRLRKAAECVLAENGLPGKKVTINATTGMVDEFRSLIEWNRAKRSVQLYLNLLYNKSAEDIIQTLAHELAHVVTGLGSEVGQMRETSEIFNVMRGKLEVQLMNFYFNTTDSAGRR